jgi:hypothetical protein
MSIKFQQITSSLCKITDDGDHPYNQDIVLTPEEAHEIGTALIGFALVAKPELFTKVFRYED